jgi:hypothetical protein
LRSSARADDPPAPHDPKTTSRIQDAKAIVEILAMVGGGIWAFFAYQSFNKIANHLATEQAKHKLEERIKIDSKIELRNMGPVGYDRFAYDVRYIYDTTVTSARSVKIDFVICEWFIGTLAGTDRHFFKANLPTQEGPLSWLSLGVEAHRADDFAETKLPDSIKKSSNRLVLHDERGVGEYSPEDVIKEYQTIHVEDTPDKWLGFALEIGLERTDGKPPDLYYDEHYVHLAAASPSTGKQGKARRIDEPLVVVIN